MARVLVKFFLLFFATYAIGVAIIVISAELCRQKVGTDTGFNVWHVLTGAVFCRIRHSKQKQTTPRLR